MTFLMISLSLLDSIDAFSSELPTVFKERFSLLDTRSEFLASLNFLAVIAGLSWAVEDASAIAYLSTVDLICDSTSVSKARNKIYIH